MPESTATLLADVMSELQIPKDVYNVVHGFGPNSAGEFLVKHPGVDAITFTGETRTGTAIMKSVANGIRPVSFELGGKNAAIVFADADFENALRPMVRSTNPIRAMASKNMSHFARAVDEKIQEIGANWALAHRSASIPCSQLVISSFKSFFLWLVWAPVTA
jgi:aldehyde dehydrogenase family protein